MKKKLLLLALLAGSAMAHAQIVNIPDPVFKSHLLMHGVDTNGDGQIQTAEAAAFDDGLFLMTTEGGVQGTINNLTGIEAFPNITSLMCKNHNLSSIDLSNNSLITFINLEGNELAAVDLSNNPLLTIVYVSSNNLTTLDVSNCPLLEDLSCSRNELTSLNVSNNPVLKKIWAPENFITSLNTTSCALIEEISIGTNELATINTTGNSMLKFLFCQDNNLTSIDVSTNTALKRLSCGNNNLTALDISENMVLEELNCGNAQIASLNLISNPLLTDVGCYNNLITSIDVSGAPNLKYLSCGNNQIGSLDVTHNPELLWLQCYGAQLTSIDVSANPHLTMLSLTNNPQLTYINAKNGNNHNMDTQEVDFQFLPLLETVCVDDAESDYAEFILNAVQYPVEVIDTCAVTMDVNDVATASFTLFPNPVNDVLHIKSPSDIVQIKIYNTLGQLVLTANNDSVNISHLSHGLYSVEITDGVGKTAAKKILKR